MKFDSTLAPVATFSFTSLTDIVLLLLIFFLLSSSFIVETGLKVEVPRADAAEARTEQMISISLTSKGEVTVNGRSVGGDSLAVVLKALIAQRPGQPVVLRADREVSLQDAVRVIDVAKSAGALRFTIATRPAGRE